MSVLFFDGFEGYQTADLTKRWTQASGTISASYKRNGAQGILLNNVTGVSKTVGPATATAGVMGAGLYWDANNTGYIEVGNGAGVQFRVIRATADGTLNIYRGGGSTLVATSAGALALDTWYHVEVKWTLDNTTGTIEVKVNGAPFVDYTGDTMQQTAATWTFVQILAGNVNTVWVDDFYICDQDGGVNDDFLGDCIVETLYPDGNGTNSEFDGSDGNQVDNYALVNESSSDFPDENTTYVSSSTVGERDTYAYGALTPATATILATQTAICATKTAAGTRTYTDVVKLSGGSEDDGSTTVGPSISSYSYGLFVRETKNGADAWTVSDVNGAEFGVKVAS